MRPKPWPKRGDCAPIVNGLYILPARWKKNPGLLLK